jgi:hypothetical protein
MSQTGRGFIGYSRGAKYNDNMYIGLTRIGTAAKCRIRNEEQHAIG